ncbi:unnamed protein product [Hermetia illucens]|uniref:CRAL-TRIO domain-containing protein n=1 Tax=Hermetia illucens TaxID=343691 RepID=A0A7R8YPR3_HERIL|nr:alpha-tocopherol transfer protein-like [Hermetia illucens]XP_037926989.1 alpha-tocopherol transfer protein-like [Hermetia illucens]XP_037926990.1 alpha-tocopherol transfer protein-like [Hermetia illucens]XP_037926991.1 alpha-tocopherol transfer protein-like [Hermetia illucens]XP_037926992.1 alpha-tocopherol transfer protein-like [Hermetia illucens]CAD7079710.1 unnamed protein product [Hermetia illucens]
MSNEITPRKTLKYDENNLPYIDLGKYKMRLEREEPTNEVLEKARIELRETPEIVEKAFKELRELIKQEKHLHLPTEDEYMRMFLRPCKYYPESAMDRIKHFYNLSLKYGKVCENIVPSTLRHVFEQEIFTLLPVRDQDGRRMIILDVGKKWKPSKCPLNDSFRAVQLAVLSSMAEPTSQINGNVVIFDMDGLPLANVMQFTPSFANMLLDYVQDCLCIRLKAVHIVFNSYIFNMLFAIFKPFIKDKLRKRIFFHGKNMDSLHQHINKECLPAKYGGTLDCELPPGYLVADLFEAYKKDFEMANSYGYTNELK